MRDEQQLAPRRVLKRFLTQPPPVHRVLPLEGAGEVERLGEVRREVRARGKSEGQGKERLGEEEDEDVLDENEWRELREDEVKECREEEKGRHLDR